MALPNTGKTHKVIAAKTQITAALTQLEQKLLGKIIDLSAEERQRYGSISEQNKLLVNKVADYRHSQPQHCASEVNWAEFELDYESRQYLESIILRLNSLVRQLESTKILHDYDNYQNSLTDYAYTQYRAAQNIPGAADKASTLKQFFARTGIKNKKTDKKVDVD